MRRIAVLFALVSCLSIVTGGWVDPSRVLVGVDPSGVGPSGSTSSPDTIVAMWVMSEQLDSNGTWDAADSPHTAWDSHGEPDSLYADTDGSTIRLMVGRRDNVTAPYDLSASRFRSLLLRESSWPLSYQQANYIWFDLSKIPDDVEIISAELCYTSDEVNDFSSNYLYAYADTFSADGAWHDAASSGISGYFRWSVSNYQYQDVAETIGWESGAAPHQENRDYFYEHGIPSEPYTGVVADGTAMSIDVTRAVQLAKDNGKTIQGWQLMSERNADFFDIQSYPSTAAHASTQNQPFFKVSYRTIDNRRQWGTSDFVFSFQTDDQDTANYSYEELIRGHDGNYTLFVRSDQIPGYSDGGTYTSASKMPPDSLRAFYDRGVDIQNHSISHGVQPLWGLADILSSVDDDSLTTYELEMSWLPVDVLGLDESLVSEFSIFAWPAGGYTARGVAVLDSLGFTWARASGSEYPTLYDGSQSPPWMGDGTFSYQVTDAPRTVVIGDSLNVFMVSNSHNTLDHLTDGAQPDSVVVANISEGFHWAFKNKVPVISFASHGQVGDYSSSTMNTDDLRTILDYIEARGDTKITSMKWWTEYWLARNPSVDPPSWAAGASATWDIFRGPSE